MEEPVNGVSEGKLTAHGCQRTGMKLTGYNVQWLNRCHGAMRAQNEGTTLAAWGEVN